MLILTKNVHFDKVHVANFQGRHFCRKKKPLRERFTTSHRACNVVVLIVDYLALIDDYFELFGSIWDHLRTILD